MLVSISKYKVVVLLQRIEIQVDSCGGRLEGAGIDKGM